MRKIQSGISAGFFVAAAICAGVLGGVLGMTVAAQAASCGSGPPPQWNQPRVKYIYSGATYGSGYGHRYASAPRVTYYSTRYSTHYSARRANYPRTSYSRSYRDGFRRW
jgi:hypothetical protein